MHSFEAKLGESWPAAEWQDVTVLLAVSGGADSVALLRAMASFRAATKGNGRLIVGHFNHGLRPEASDDEAFVKGLCDTLSVYYELGYSGNSWLEEKAGEGIESAARKARYAFLEQAAHRHGARFVVTAHTADDQAETVLHRIVRGTGIAGLAGIPRSRQLRSTITLIRPPLSTRRMEVVSYLNSIGQSHCEDASNSDPRYTRNRIRQDLLPRLSNDYNECITESLLRLATLAGEAQAVIETLVERLIEEAVLADKDSIVVRTEPLQAQPSYLIRQLFKTVWRQQAWPEQSMTHQHWGQLAELVTRGLGSSQPILVFPGRLRAESRDGQLVIARPKIQARS